MATDINHDGNLDILLVGNDYATEVLSGLQDAGLGLCLLGDGRGNFKALAPSTSGFVVDKDAKALTCLMLGNGKLYYMATQNNGPLRVYSAANSQTTFKRVESGTFSLSEPVGRGKKRKVEFSYGSGYLSQSSRVIPMGNAEK